MYFIEYSDQIVYNLDMIKINPIYATQEIQNRLSFFIDKINQKLAKPSKSLHKIDNRLIAIRFNHNPGLAFSKEAAVATTSAQGNHLVELNLNILKNRTDLENILYHEICHILINLAMSPSLSQIKDQGHNQNWQKLMIWFEQIPAPTNNLYQKLDLKNNPYQYQCHCPEEKYLTPQLHQMVMKQSSYCVHCNQPLVLKQKVA